MEVYMTTKKEKILVPQCLSNLVPLKKGFTLAEVLITLGIIGIVAAMTIPTLISNYQQRSWDTASSVFNRRLGEALKVMNTNSALAGYATTQDFVNELGKNIKIVRTCDSDHLTDCFTETINTGADPIYTIKLKKSKNLYSVEDYGTETIGIQFADGVSALIAYNKRFYADSFSSDAVRVTGSENQKSVGLDTKALSILYDVSGSKSPNSYGTGKDVRGINIAIKTGAEILVLGSNYSPVDCTNPTADGYKYCNANDINQGYSESFWVGAQYNCAKLGMRLPTVDELRELYAKKGEEGIPTSGAFFASTEFSPTTASCGSFDDGYFDGNCGKGRPNYLALCVGN